MRPGWPRLRSVAVVVLVTAAVLTDWFASSLLVATVAYLGAMVAASVVAWVGAERAPHRDRLAPRLVAAGISMTALGDVLWAVLDAVGRDTDVSIADPAWFASYVFVGGALWIVLARSGPGQRVDLAIVIDAVTIVTVSVLIFWSASVATILADDRVGFSVRAVWAAYPVADAILLALAARVLFSRSGRAAVDLRFAVGISLWLAADVAYLETSGGVVATALTDAGWMLAPVLMAGACWRSWHPEVGDTVAPRAAGWVPQLMIAVGPLVVPPALELTADLRGRPDQPVELFVGTAVLVTLAFVRTGRLLRSEQRAHREAELARDAALEASQAKSVFVANMSHEIRTPLTTVLAAAEMLEDTPLVTVQLDLLSRMNRSGEQLLSLVEEILDFSRVEAGQVDLQLVAFDLPALVSEIEAGYVPQARQHDIAFETRLDPAVPSRVVGDPTRLFQIVTNLLDNALKFTHQGSVRLDVVPVAGGQVSFVVTDTGIGIREADREHVFDLFHQVDGTATRRYGGSGLGLAICRELAGLMGGGVRVDSEPGSGSTFTVTIPLEPVVRDRVGRPDMQEPEPLRRGGPGFPDTLYAMRDLNPQPAD